MASEIELKLEVRPDAADVIEHSLLLSGRPDVIDQRAVYFDTPDRALFKAGLTLRIRRSGGDAIQTVKATGAATVSRRRRAPRSRRSCPPWMTARRRPRRSSASCIRACATSG